MLNTSKMFFLFIMAISIVIVISSESWLGMWMGLEMNLISFIPILFSSKNNSSSESCMIYFLTQSLGSILMLMSVLLNSSFMLTPLMSEELFNTMLMFSMLIKLGVPPFHFWFPEILEKATWSNCFILMIGQKIAPLFILSHVISSMPVVIIMITAMTGSIGGLNQTSIRKIMGYSSINHLSWTMACMKFNNEMWPLYWLIYSLITLMMIIMLQEYYSFHINQLLSLNSSFMEKSLIITLFLSLGGMPPFIGFLPKWLVIQAMITSSSITTLMIMIMSSLITLFYYLRLISSTLLINSSSMKWYQTNEMNSNLIMLMLMINISLPVVLTFSF
uniref:NADH-ubiquinone oxidoreductase chain 2 n=1 Tax=Rhodnius pictipes TaxID=69253 RepID=A0A6L1G3H4_9HEMI|nr:TPA_asm: NADH dehydrogenase subunit 2 [Rhodnius pictipes]